MSLGLGGNSEVGAINQTNFFKLVGEAQIIQQT